MLDLYIPGKYVVAYELVYSKGKGALRKLRQYLGVYDIYSYLLAWVTDSSTTRLKAGIMVRKGQMLSIALR